MAAQKVSKEFLAAPRKLATTATMTSLLTRAGLIPRISQRQITALRIIARPARVLSRCSTIKRGNENTTRRGRCCQPRGSSFGIHQSLSETRPLYRPTCIVPLSPECIPRTSASPSAITTLQYFSSTCTTPLYLISTFPPIDSF